MLAALRTPAVTRPVLARLAHSVPAGSHRVAALAEAPEMPEPGYETPSHGSALAVYSRASADKHDARKRAMTLYRQWLKNADHIVQLYYLDMPAHAIRQRVRAEFEKHRYVEDLGTIDVMLWKGHLELQETLNLWKQTTHIMRYFENREFGDQKKGAFLDKFLAGR
ncbi:hypothetical protein GGF32_006998 [Allomyces javanicus]|nr:hypothetical protein GGF32_006998 [Allomyces javanicus]